MDTITINLTDYQPYPKNPNTHPDNQLSELGRSLDKFGQYKNVVVWNGYYLAGHGLVEAAREQGLSSLDAVDMSHLSEQDAEALMVADNRLPEMAEMDFSVLGDVLGGFDEPLDIPGVDEDFLKGLDIGTNGTGRNVEPLTETEAEKYQKKWSVKPGQVWQLGKHKIACANSLEDEIVTIDEAGMIWADPPYGINIVAANGYVGGGEANAIPFGGAKNDRRRGYVGGGARHKDLTGKYPIQETGKKKGLGSAYGAKPFGSEKVRGSDGASNLIAVGKYFPVVGDDTIETAVKASAIFLERYPDATHIWWGANYYAHTLPPSPGWIVWDKDNTGNFADCEMAWTNQYKAARIFQHRWNGLLKASEQGQRRLHPTQKPITLAYECFLKCGKSDDVIIDPFSGSGISILAAEQLGYNRKVIAFEIVPEYVSATLERFQNHTGIEPQLLS